MKIVECRVIRPKDRRSVVLATAELLFDNGIRVVNMHLLKPREGDEGSQLRIILDDLSDRLRFPG